MVLARRPAGAVAATDFAFRDQPIPEPGDGQFLVRNHWLSLDPYMRGRMNAVRSYARPVEIGAVMVGGAVGEVIRSRHQAFRSGEFVVGPFGWQCYAVSDGTGVRRIPESALAHSVYLGAVGMPGVTAYVGTLDICAPQPGQTVVVSAAAGAVGSAAGQIAKMHGCRAVGIAGGPEKCRYVVDELGFDACLDYKAEGFHAHLRAATSHGVDAVFENVGGAVFDAVLRRLNPFSRIALCGLVSQYDATRPYAIKNAARLLVNRTRLQGFIVTDHPQRWPVALADLERWVASGRLKYRETVAHGLENAPAAFIGMLHGANIGKQLVRLV